MISTVAVILVGILLLLEKPALQQKNSIFNNHEIHQSQF